MIKIDDGCWYCCVLSFINVVELLLWLLFLMSIDYLLMFYSFSFYRLVIVYFNKLFYFNNPYILSFYLILYTLCLYVTLILIYHLLIVCCAFVIILVFCSIFISVIFFSLICSAISLYCVDWIIIRVCSCLYHRIIVFILIYWFTVICLIAFILVMKVIVTGFYSGRGYAHFLW